MTTPNGENNDTGSNFHVNPAPKPPKKKGASRAVALVLCCALVGGGAGLGGAALYDRLGGGSSDGTTIYQNTTQGTQVNVQQADGVKEMTLEEIYASYADSCVNVTCQVVVQRLAAVHRHLQRLRLHPLRGRLHCHQLPRH